MTELALGTWNLLHGLRVRPPGPVDPTGGGDPTDPGHQVPPGTVDAPALARSVGSLDLDVLGLQEVDRHQERSGGADQTADVAAAMGAASWRFVPALHGTPGTPAGWVAAQAVDGAETDGPTYGVGLVSRLPVREWRVLRFPAARASIPLLVPGAGIVRVPDEPRVAVAGVLDAPWGGAVTVGTCHLSFVPGTNVRQLRAICRWLAALPAPRLLLGDLNLPGRLPGLLSRWEQLARVRTYPSWRPRVQWDHALADGVAGVRTASARAVALPVSDHRALRVVLTR